MKKYLFSILFFVLSFLFSKQVLAVCPICTVAVGAGVGFSRSLGADDSIIGLWIGGLIVSMIIWTMSWLKAKNINFPFRLAATIILYYSMVILPLYFMGIMTNPLSSSYTFGADKIFLGIMVGSLGFLFGANWYQDMKEKNSNQAYFPFQKVVMPIIPLVIMSIIFYLITK